MALPLAYHWRNLFVRKTTTVLTILVVAAVIGTFSWMFSFAIALQDTLSVAGDRQKLIVLRRGCESETQSAIPIPDFNKLYQLSEVERDPANGNPLISPETLIQVRIPRKSDNGKTSTSVAVRGSLEIARQVHRNVRLQQGRWFDPAAREIVVGAAAARQFTGLAVGQAVELGFGGDRTYTIVGLFTADGGPLESEIWGYLPSLLNAYNRSLYSSASLRLKPGTDPRAVIAQIEGPAIQLTSMTEDDYWVRQSSRIGGYLRVAYALVGVMFVAAIFAVAITMFSAVAGRAREIGMLRTLGFSRFAILGGFMLEAVMLCVIGGLVGCTACAAWLALFGGAKDMYGTSTFTTLAFNIRLTPETVAGSLGCVALVGVIGAFAPAWRASKLRVINVLRAA
ncbi:MAG TPA: ABC transporter permease [Phycisphaerae bacterium]|nr:ABC transporter permease [Phycisphaerae bacterium]